MGTHQRSHVHQHRQMPWRSRTSIRHHPRKRSFDRKEQRLHHHRHWTWSTGWCQCWQKWVPRCQQEMPGVRCNRSRIPSPNKQNLRNHCWMHSSRIVWTPVGIWWRSKIRKRIVMSSFWREIYYIKHLIVNWRNNASISIKITCTYLCKWRLTWIRLGWGSVYGRWLTTIRTNEMQIRRPRRLAMLFWFMRRKYRW